MLLENWVALLPWRFTILSSLGAFNLYPNFIGAITPSFRALVSLSKCEKLPTSASAVEHLRGHLDPPLALDLKVSP